MPYGTGSYNKSAPKGAGAYSNPAPDLRGQVVRSSDKTKDLFKMDADMIRNAPWYKGSK